MDLSDTQHRLLAYLREHIARHGYPPSQMEIARRGTTWKCSHRRA